MGATDSAADRAPRAVLLAHPGVDIEERTGAEIAIAVAEGSAEFGVVAAAL